jgi:tRNA(adenine34) deaminase
MTGSLGRGTPAAAAEEVPVGAVIVFQGRVIARGRNRIRELKDPTAHAEVLAMRAAGQHLKSERLRETTLYTTLEPCALCAGGIVLARIPRVVFAAADPKAGAAGSVMDLLRHSQLKPSGDVTGGVLPGLSRQLLQREDVLHCQCALLACPGNLCEELGMDCPAGVLGLYAQTL